MPWTDEILLNSDLADLYEVNTKRLNEQVKCTFHRHLKHQLIPRPPPLPRSQQQAQF